MEKKVLLAISLTGILVLIFWPDGRVNEEVARKERVDHSTAAKHDSRDIYYFKSGNYAVVSVVREQGRSDRYIKYAPNGRKLEEGRLVNGEFDRDYNDSDSWWERLLAFMIGVWILTIIFWFKHMASFCWMIIDKVRNARTLPFARLTKEEQLELIKANNDCADCHTSPDLTFLREEKMQGMSFIYCRCSKCGEEKKIRIK
jgi:hypothetical protein